MENRGIKNSKHISICLNPNANVFTPCMDHKEAIIANVDILNTELAKVTTHILGNTEVDLLSQNIEITGAYDITHLKELRTKYPHKIIICHLNINSIRNKIDTLANFVVGIIDIMLISESKIDCSFPTGQFIIPGFSPPYRKDRTDREVGFYYT